ncbi:methyltransferase type 12 [Thiohalorhabdus denitrificans]|uniref:Methyltransferase domain-containing protein n=1 Tax=Thiohalorhabdus denitrificans TaxID=381306 RepID=A0A0P9C2E8_9GAMM|nr:class I SAM-dependent methyltransferase [Thiohalorhabdus denitrificans]KPV39129.1 methyltransferase type 12 [Thiohalorhabdus denitrificans]SCX76891.1 Methyltransferase domain-containing protein [Thiohalorhabdus denitrificans]
MQEPDWDKRYRERSVGDSDPVAVLEDNRHLLPAGGMALDLACGLGANAVLLAEQGLKTFAWDRSSVAVEKLAAWSRENLLPITAEVRDVVVWPPEPGRFDVIVVGHFLERQLAGALRDALNPGGLLFYQTFTQTRVSDRGPRTERFRLADNELLHLFADLQVLVYREEGRVGDTARGVRDEAQLVARKPE